MALVLRDKLELARMEERAIIKAVRTAWEAKGGKPRPARVAAAEAAPAIDPAPTAQPEAIEQDVAPMTDLNEMFLELLAEEAAAKPASDDLNSMFTELLAEVSGVDPRPTVAEVVEAKPKKARAKKAKAEPAEPWRTSITKARAKAKGLGISTKDKSIYALVEQIEAALADTIENIDTTRLAARLADPEANREILEGIADNIEAVTGTRPGWNDVAPLPTTAKKPYEMVEEVNANWRKLHSEHRQWFTGDGPYKLKADAPADVKAAYKAHQAAKKAAQAAMDAPPSERPLAAAGLTSYRYNGPMGPVMIGAKNDADALAQAGQSITDIRHQVDRANLQVWDGNTSGYVAVDKAPATVRATADSHIRKFAKKPGDVKNEQVRKVLLDAGPMAAEVAAILGEEGHLVTAVGKAMDEFGYKFVSFDGLRPIFEKPGAKTEERGAGEAAVSAVKNTAVGFAAAIAGLGEIFGANVDGKMSIVDLDETKYQRAQPYFTAAVEHFGNAAADIREVMRAVIKSVLAQFGHQATVNMQPYIVRFTEEYRAGKHQGEKENATDRSTGSPAGDQKHRPDGHTAAERDIFHVEPAADGEARAADAEPDEAGPGQRDSTGVSGRDAAPDRA